jgi:spore germination protein
MKKHTRRILVVAILVTMLLILAVPVASASGGTYHTVRYGETLFSIGRYYGVYPYHIAEVNNLYNPNYIYAGQVLYIPSGQPGYPGYPGYPGNPCQNHHVVRYGETLSSIGRMYGVSPWAIARANGIYNMNLIYAGQVLYIPHYDGGYYSGCGGSGGSYYPRPEQPIYYPPVPTPY